MAKKKIKKKTTTKEAKQIAEEVKVALDAMIADIKMKKTQSIAQNVCGHDKCPLCDWLKKNAK